MLSPLNPNLIFEVIQHGNGGFSASCLNARLTDTGGRNLEELHDNITALIDTSYTAGTKPQANEVHLLMFQDEGVKGVS